MRKTIELKDNPIQYYTNQYLSRVILATTHANFFPYIFQNGQFVLSKCSLFRVVIDFAFVADYFYLILIFISSVNMDIGILIFLK